MSILTHPLENTSMAMTVAITNVDFHHLDVFLPYYDVYDVV